MKIQINSLAALERLIGNDNQLEIDIRNSVVQEFTRKHLKALADDALISRTSEAIQSAIHDEFFESVRVNSYGQTKTVFKSEKFEQIKAGLINAVQSELSALVDKAMQAANVQEFTNIKLAEAAEKIANQLTDRNLEERLNRMVDQRIKTKLGL